MSSGGRQPNQNVFFSIGFYITVQTCKNLKRFFTMKGPSHYNCMDQDLQKKWKFNICWSYSFSANWPYSAYPPIFPKIAKNTPCQSANKIMSNSKDILKSMQISPQKASISSFNAIQSQTSYTLALFYHYHISVGFMPQLPDFET